MCVEVDLDKPLKSGDLLRGKLWRLQYEGCMRFSSNVDDMAIVLYCVC